MNLAKYIQGRPAVLEERERRHQMVMRMIYHFADDPEIRVTTDNPKEDDASLFKKFVNRIRGGN